MGLMNDDVLYRYLAAGVTAAERERVEAWRAADPAHQRRLDQLGRVLELADRTEAGLGGDRPPSAAAVIRRGAVERRTPSALHWASQSLLATAAAAIIAIAALLAYRELPAFGFAAREIVTGPGELATVTLTDGSRIRLGPDSRLEVGTSSRDRELTLEGRVFVVENGGKPLTIRTRAGSVTARAARFDVQSRRESLVVIAVAGSVRLERYGSRVEIGAGRGAAIHDDEILPAAPVADLPARTAWAAPLSADSARLP